MIIVATHVCKYESSKQDGRHDRHDNRRRFISNVFYFLKGTLECVTNIPLHDIDRWTEICLIMLESTDTQYTYV